VTSSSSWIGGSRLLDIALPDDLELPPKSGRDRTTASKLLIWDFHSDFDGFTLAAAIKELWQSAEAEQSEPEGTPQVYFYCNILRWKGVPAVAVCHTHSQLSDSVRERFLKKVRETPIQPPGIDVKAESRAVSADWIQNMNLVMRPHLDKPSPNTISSSAGCLQTVT